ncbi:hypothetical protein Hanom_Chr17g01555881 [Helianthus anomalus]
MKRHWKIHVQVYGHKYTVTDDVGLKYEFTDPNAAQGAAEDVEMGDEDEPAGPRGPQQRYMRPHQEISGGVANFVKCQLVPGYPNFNHGQQAIFDNVSTGS